ncbi:MAG: hypothetical protein GY953_31555 [bacterium]|nr:hypothetical protein [bacterium]
MKKLVVSMTMLVLGGGVLLASDTMPRSSSSVSSASRGCPTSSLEGTIADVDSAKGMFSLLAADSPQEFLVNGDTRYRIPGVKKNALKNDPLAKLPENATAKVSFCKGTQRVVEVKVQKAK